MKPTLGIRPAAIKDLGDVKRLLCKCDLPVDGLDEQFGEAYCVAERNGQIVGVGGVEVFGSHGLLRSVAVSPGLQGRSLGEVMVKNRLAWANSKGLYDVFLLTIAAEHYFRRFGFRSIDRDAVPSEVKKSSEFSSVCPESATVMVKSLCDSTSSP